MATVCWALVGLGTVSGAGGCDRAEAVVPASGEPASERAGSPDAAAEPSTIPAPAAGERSPSADASAPTVTPPTAATPREPPSSADAGECPTDVADDLGLMISPERAMEGEPLRIVAATLSSEEPLALRLEDDDGRPVAAELVHYEGVPAATIARLTAPAAGTRIEVVVGRNGQGLGCQTLRVRGRVADKRKVRTALEDGVWPVTRAWDASEEALYSAWVRELFHAPPGEELAWSALHEVTTDADRNVLHDFFGWGEDSPPMKAGLYLKPDCADTPYFLRAYFAWKRELPFGYRLCSRGADGSAPSCGNVRGVLGKPDIEPDKRLPGELGVVQRFFRRTLSWGVHTGNGRTAYDDGDSDFYPLALSRRSLRPGIIYADPYGHIFVLAEMVPAQGEQPGILYAIDGQPDGSITRKRFWEGNFLWNPDPALGGSGFKGFRPHLVTEDGGRRRLAAASDEQLRSLPGYGDVSQEQATLDAAAFYDHMDGLITPGVRDPFVAQEEAIRALHESAKVRVTSVDNGEANFAKSGREVSMPDGFEIFETTGAWENFSTPARDLRLLIAIDVATGFEAKVARSPAAWGVEAAGGLEAVRTRLAAERERLLADPALAFSYTRSDGSEQTLTLAELVARAPALEVAYNPNDCAEIRWGAPERSKERSTCRRRAPEEQRRKMSAYRPWFRDRRRPPRGDPGPAVE
ncbi:hypothetical protein [Paraliomyxa miuraensis]|uniref:hypothetical protein n=1 Tax=Paraliomyxa miuraensis TaxID=376150 RepID=UPI00224DEAE4|nr:hypothetical protein [Paraliomyxa miuraensis]MCX4239551.1 hypothetical protein [Paraliomyxa miuraensis]